MPTYLMDGREVEMAAAQMAELEQMRALFAAGIEPPPIVVSAAQAKTALYAAGLYEQVETALGQSPYALIRIWWGAAGEWRKDHPYVLAVAAELGLSDDQVDTLFEAARAVAA